ncbi:MAG: methionine--tRNA ligase, partial [Muribaculaceae bacterium]|nr:methionine--tRNA ligase [Muribaculaceae bacterium]
MDKDNKKFKRTLITSALPYANGPVHIGHLAGVYVPADIYARYLRLKGEEVMFIGGSDEHGVPITIKAKAEGVTPQDIVDRYHNIIKDSFEQLGISFDVYGRTTSETHRRTASEFFRRLYDKGEFIEKTSMQLYDEQANQFLADRYVVGTCPHCGNERAYGDQCEACGTSLNATDLINPRSAITGNVPVMRETSHWYLPLDKWEPRLRKWILEDHKEWKTNVYGQCKSWLDMGLQPRAVSRDLDWGIPVPVEGAEGKVLYVWFDAPIGYISNTIDIAPDSWEKWWKDPETRMLHFIGKDNIVFHCIVFPAMLMADGTYNLPDNVPANEFLNLEDDKISTSRNWAVWLHEYLQELPGKQDVLRYVLTANAPETKDNNFTWKDFQARNNSELVAILGNFVNRAMVLVHKYFDGVVPVCGELTEADRNVMEEVRKAVEAEGACMDTFKFREALKEAMNIARAGNKYLADTEPWKLAKTDMERVGTILNIAIQICANLAVAFEPFMPFMGADLAAQLHL